ncbi:hypothetical protein CLNEO_25260 [Anaerotignum neopropionicum]|uniref:Universal stress protein family protein n=1 Tax=Anaerotignum neopropionicum TaxID=36847 RepID=A0A136WBZ0_9FIRM|nr:hypothetical protein [Anaerotignum neopropionicum]KXL52010.1 hypothetical protein CLNEO_25260 [Anaerotignum neopropionicum]
MITEKKEKVLVLATAQKNALRLIDYGFSLALANDGELHILHVQKGTSVFDGKDTLKRLQELIDYGSRLGACIHVQCDNDVAGCVGGFIEKEEITRVILGEAPLSKEEKALGEWDRIVEVIPETVRLHVVVKEEIQLHRMII